MSPLAADLLPLSTIATLVVASVATVSLIVTLLRVGASAIRSSQNVSSSITQLTDAVKKIEDRVEGYIESGLAREGSMEAWRRTVQERLAALDANIISLQKTLEMVIGPSVRGRRGRQS